MCLFYKGSFLVVPVTTARIVINLILEPKMGSPLEVSNIGVIFSVQGDPIWATLPPGTPSVRFEQNFVEGIMPFTFSESKIVVKSLFPILDLKKKQKSPFFWTLFIMKIWFITNFVGFWWWISCEVPVARRPVITFAVKY